LNVLITGGTGLLGWWLVNAFSNAGYDVYANYHSHMPSSFNDVVRLELAWKIMRK